MTRRELFGFARKSLASAGFSDTAEFEAKCILKSCCGVDLALVALENSQATNEEHRAMREMLNRRLMGEPLQYVLGEWDFLGLPFFLDKQVLIPRADTEILAQRLIEKFKDNNDCRILDIGSGSGAIGVSAAFFIAKARITALDISPPALELTLKNAARHGVQNRLTVIEGDILKGIDFKEPFDAIVSNPPYIPVKDIPQLDRSVREFEPLWALDGGVDGLDFYRAIVKHVPTSLKTGGYLFFEVGVGQAYDVVKILETEGFGKIKISHDLSGIERVVEGVKP